MKIALKEKKALEKKAAIYKAVAHPVRLAILRKFCFCGCEMLTVKSIYEELGIEQPIASHHLGILKGSGLLRRESKNGKTYYCVCEDNVCISGIMQNFSR